MMIWQSFRRREDDEKKSFKTKFLRWIRTERESERYGVFLRHGIDWHTWASI